MAYTLSKVNALKRTLTSQDVRLKRDVKDLSFFYGAVTAAFMFIGCCSYTSGAGSWW